MLRLSFVFGLFVILISPLFLLPYVLAAAICVGVYLCTGGWYWVRIAWKTLGRDLHAGKCIVKIEYKIRSMVRNKVTLADIFLEKVKEYPNKKAYVSVESGESLTFKEANELSNKIGNFFLKAGYKRGDVISLMMENRIEYIPIWLGLSKVGIVSSLINTNLKADGLEHCLKISESKALIYTNLYENVISEIKISDVKLYKYDETSSDANNPACLYELIKNEDVAEPLRQEISLLDKFMYIYTSGTTGFPKAAIIRGVRFAYMGFGNGVALQLTSDDIGYCPLPLYHTTGGVGLAGGCLFFGCTFVIRKRFSASKFFEECYKYKCTVFNYIGEVCTYLLAQPSKTFDNTHQVTRISGAGLRPTVWREFQERFNIHNICEMYGATEGNATVINLCGHVGAVGYRSVLFPFLLPVKLLKLNKETGTSFSLLVSGFEGNVRFQTRTKN